MRTGPYTLLRDFAQKHPNTRSALDHWYELISGRNFRSIAELREVFLMLTELKVGLSSILEGTKHVLLHLFTMGGRRFLSIVY